jgi:hypothetical protein
MKKEILVMGTEAGAILGCTRQRVNYLQLNDPEFPKPAATVGAGRIWYTKDIEAYAKKRNARPNTGGRPRKAAAPA